MAMHTFVRVNGRGNAWPVFLGGKSKFYNTSSEDLSNASYSLINCNKGVLSADATQWEVLIDAGHHTVPFLIKNGNRIPEAVVLTHGHMDHTLGLDWVAQSRYRLSNFQEKLSVYATLPVWEFVVQSFPHLKSIINYHELLPAKRTAIDEANGLFATAFPVFHGESAKGASMLLFETTENKSVIFTGDMLCPLLRKRDYDKIKNANIIFIDSNNRFPYPASNHGSIVAHAPNSHSVATELTNWFNKASLNYLLSPHNRHSFNQTHHNYFNEFLNDYKEVEELPHTVFDFAKLSNITNFELIHYGGMEDINFHKTPEISSSELQEWVNEQALANQLPNTRFNIPKTNNITKL